MTTQTDFLGGAGELVSLPPHLDPARVAGIHQRDDRDGDHVGVEAVGRFGHSPWVVVVEVKDKSGQILFAEQCVDQKAADRLTMELWTKINGYRQAELFAQ